MERVGSAVTCYRVCCLSWNWFDLHHLSNVYCLQDKTQEQRILCQLSDLKLHTTPTVCNVVVVVEVEVVGSGGDYYYSVQWQCQWFSQSVSGSNIIPWYLSLLSTCIGIVQSVMAALWWCSIWDGSSTNCTLHQDQYHGDCIGGLVWHPWGRWLLLLHWKWTTPGPNLAPRHLLEKLVKNTIKVSGEDLDWFLMLAGRAPGGILVECSETKWKYDLLKVKHFCLH